MPVSTPLQTQIDAIQSRINALASSATAEDVVMLAKAVEAVAGQATVFDVIHSGEAAKAHLDHTLSTHTTQLEHRASAGVAEIDLARQGAIDEVQAAGHTLANLHAISLVF